MKQIQSLFFGGEGGRHLTKIKIFSLWHLSSASFPFPEFKSTTFLLLPIVNLACRAKCDYVLFVLGAGKSDFAYYELKVSSIHSQQ